MEKIPTARTTLLQMVQLFIEGIATPVGQRWNAYFPNRGTAFLRNLQPSPRTRQADPLHPKATEQTPTYFLWGLDEDELQRLKGEHRKLALAAGLQKNDPGNDMDVNGVEALHEEVAGLRLDIVAYKAYIASQDIVIEHLLAYRERMGIVGTHFIFPSRVHISHCIADESSRASSASSHMSTQSGVNEPEEHQSVTGCSSDREDLPAHVIYPPANSHNVPSAIVIPQSHDDEALSKRELQDTAAWRKRPFGAKSSQYLAEHSLHVTWHSLLHKIAFELAPAEWGRCLCDYLTQSRPEEATHMLELAFGLADAMCDDRGLQLKYSIPRTG